MLRVAVTGIGAVSPNGIGRETFWRATVNGESGVRRITRFDPSGFTVQVAGQVFLWLRPAWRKPWPMRGSIPLP